MARCQQCGHFASYDDCYEPETDDVEVDADNQEITGNVRVALVSDCCGDEMKDYSFEISHDIAAEIDAFRKQHKLKDDDEIEGELYLEAEMTSHQQTTDRHGKPIKNHRYMKTFYGYNVSGTMTLRAEKGKKSFEEEVEIAFDDEAQASFFDELY